MDFSYKKALLRFAQTWTVSDDMLTTPNGKRLDLREVKEARFTDIADIMVKRRWNTEMVLKSSNDKVSILCNDVRGGAQRHQYFLLLFEVLRSLNTCNPELKIQHGLGRIANYAFAAIGLLPIGFGLAMIIDGLQRGFDTFPLVFGGGFALMGVFLIWCASPWQAAPMRSPSDLAVWLSQSTGIQPLAMASSPIRDTNRNSR
ncbi:MAG: hypothetical protein AAFR58_02850 [Cyanobacteria bacterium J06627_28]